jgi:uncharacterized protein (TIGR00369 family)
MEVKMAARRQPDPNWEQSVRASFARQRFMRLIGAQIESLAPGGCILALPARADLSQQRGLLHGGVTAALADTAGGYAAYSLMPAGSSPLTVEFKINLMAPALGERFVASAKVVRAGRTLTVVEADVTAQTKGVATPIARMLATLICLENTPDQPDQAAGRAV